MKDAVRGDRSSPAPELEENDASNQRAIDVNNENTEGTTEGAAEGDMERATEEATGGEAEAASERKVKDKPPKLCCSARVWVTAMSFLAMLNISYVRVGITMALICMTHPKPPMEDGQSYPEFIIPNIVMKDITEFHWSAVLQGYLMSAVFYGFILGPCVSGFLSYKFGGKLVLVIGTLSIGVTNLFAPEAAKLTPYLFFAVRVLTGFFAGFLFPAFYDLVSHWIVPEERQLLVTAALAGIPFANIINFPIGGALCDCCGWVWLFYAVSIWIIIWGIVFQFTLTDYPDQCSYISREELLFLTSRIPKPAKQKIPWKFILKSLPIYAYIAIHFCVNYVYLTIILSLPLLLSHIHKLSILENSLLSATPFVGAFFTRVFLSLFFERLRMKLKLSKNALRKIFVLIGAVLVAVFLLAITFLNHSQRYWVVTCFVLALTSLELCLTGGYLTSLLDLCPSYANILSGISNTIGNSAGLICPVVNGLITVHGTKEEYNAVYYVNVLILLAASAFYLVFGQNTLQKWGLAQRPSEVPVPETSSVR